VYGAAITGPAGRAKWRDGAASTYVNSCKAGAECDDHDSTTGHWQHSEMLESRDRICLEIIMSVSVSRVWSQSQTFGRGVVVRSLDSTAIRGHNFDLDRSRDQRHDLQNILR